MIGVYDYTVIATYLAALLGLSGIFQAMGGHILPAIFCLLLSGLLDAFDGRIARTKKDRTEEEKRFGIQIDSLNDLICFGVLPSVIAYNLYDNWYGAVPGWATACCCFFVLCGLIRLAYFNVEEEQRQEEFGNARSSYLGMPITSATVAIPLFYLLCILFPGARVALLSFVLCSEGLLFIMPIRVKKPQITGLIVFGALATATLIGLLLNMFGIIG